MYQINDYSTHSQFFGNPSLANSNFQYTHPNNKKSGIIIANKGRVYTDQIILSSQNFFLSPSPHQDVA